MLKRLMGWLVNFCPHNVIYSSEFMPELRFEPGDGESHKAAGSAAALGVAVAAQRTLKEPGAIIACEYTGVTDGGRDIGDFRVTVERLR